MRAVNAFLVTLVAGVLVVLGLLPATPAHAAETCQGQTATIVGEPGGDVVGTTGPDVVVTNGAATTRTGEGDDAVCVTGNTGLKRRARVETSSGEDSVTSSGANRTLVILGADSDTFVGGRQEDTVYGGEIGDFGDHGDEATDEFHTGNGGDAVVSGSQNLANEDVVDLGPGDDYANVSGTSATGITGGPGDNTLRLQTSGEVGDDGWRLDTRHENLTRLGVPHYSWTDFAGFDLEHVGYSLPLYVKGSPRDERFLANGRGSDAGPVDIFAGKGEDFVAINSSHSDGTVFGGPERDRLFFESDGCRGRLTLDLAHGRARTTCDGRERFAAAHFEDVTVSGFASAAVYGTKRANTIKVGRTCDIAVRGSTGADRIQILGYFVTSCGRFGLPEAFARLEGEGGDDVLIGGKFGDRLFGGNGRDEARGRGGVDVCVAEERQGCERR